MDSLFFVGCWKHRLGDLHVTWVLPVLFSGFRSGLLPSVCKVCVRYLGILGLGIWVVAVWIQALSFLLW